MWHWHVCQHLWSTGPFSSLKVFKIACLVAKLVFFDAPRLFRLSLITCCHLVVDWIHQERHQKYYYDIFTLAKNNVPTTARLCVKCWIVRTALSKSDSHMLLKRNWYLIPFFGHSKVISNMTFKENHQPLKPHLTKLSQSSELEPAVQKVLFQNWTHRIADSWGLL